MIGAPELKTEIPPPAGDPPAAGGAAEARGMAGKGGDGGKGGGVGKSAGVRRGTALWKWVRRIFLGVVILILATVAAAWMERGPIVDAFERSVHQRLGRLGLDVHYASRSWSFAHGLRLEEASLVRIDKGNDHPVALVSGLEVGFSAMEWLKTRTLITHWVLKNALVVLYDDEGSMTFEHVNARMLARPGRIETPQVEFQQGPRTFALRGEILTAITAHAPPARVALDLGVPRDVLGVLDFAEGHPPFHIQGSYSLDFRAEAAAWQADLTGAGQNVEWQGVPLRKATAQGRFSPAGMQLTAQLQFTKGAAGVAVERRDWDRSPLLIEGTFTDGARRKDDFSSAYDGVTGQLTVSELRGKAQLLEFARNFPRQIPWVPTLARFQKFPDLAVKNFACSFSEAPAPWSVESIQTRSPADLTVQAGGDPITLTGVEGRVSRMSGQLKAQIKSSSIRWRNMTSPGASVEGALAGTRLQAKLEARLSKGAVAADLSTADYVRKPVDFTGSITDAQGLVDRVSGTYQYDPEELRLARLEGKANLLEFAGNFPGLTDRMPKTVQFRTFPDLAVSDFVMRAGRPVTLGSLRLVEPADLTLALRGRPVTLERVEGQASFDGNAWKFSHAHGGLFGGEWSMEGILRGAILREAKISASRVHLAEAKAWMGESPRDFGKAVLALEYGGDVGADVAQFTGAGTIRLENAPLVKVPLLDQTYTVASNLLIPLPRHGAGHMEAEFAAKEGIVKVSKFLADSEAVNVKAGGTVDLRKRVVSGKARANIRGVVGIATEPISRALEMEVSGSLDNIQVKPLGLKGLVDVPKKIVPDTVKGAVKLLEKAVTAPVRAIEGRKRGEMTKPE